jgi:(E)-4-hydroxy-3-methylbut-2-enyl-diphosphate synthase
MIKRRKTKKIMIGNVPVGGTAPISVQSMTTTETSDVDSTAEQIKRLEKAGCEIVRCAANSMRAARAISEIKKRIKIPLVADVHFNYKYALESIKSGADAVRINPGNISDVSNVKEIVKAASSAGIPIRVGVNSGSIPNDILKEHKKPTAKALFLSAKRSVNMIEDMGFTDIKISLKSSDVVTTIEAYKLVSKEFDYPLHLGITEAGTIFSGTIKSSIGIGALLYMGIGDTIRVSLTSKPEDEIRAGFEILKALKLREHGIDLISCPTCGRCEIDIISIARKVEKSLAKIKKPLTVAVMGCVVNGPGEAREADIGIAGGKGAGLMFKKGKVIRKLKEDELAVELVKEVKKLCKD